MSQTVESRAESAGSGPLQAWWNLFDGCTHINELTAREHATTLGVIQRLRLVPGQSMEATITDGTGKLRAVWTEVEVMGGLELGRGLRLQGTVCTDGDVPVMRNPTWCLVRDPYACSELKG
ncbi:OB-fold nucleic acid binding domain-containing protein [Euzebya tangerina]|uniref:OB-fold nucleic acid binding domain-containing protein n=1 Tax=Euzebya tangerina TaxID=591198 RepID=UPI000E312F1B|nr:OB-fold nucleic acid binding domain-containing protein [Euzebya tangerina]